MATEKTTKVVDWTNLSSDEDEDADDHVEAVPVKQTPAAPSGTQQPVQDKKPAATEKPTIIPYKEAIHNNTRKFANAQRVKGGFKPEAVQKKASNIKAARNPFDLGGNSDEGEQTTQPQEQQVAETPQTQQQPKQEVAPAAQSLVVQFQSKKKSKPVKPKEDDDLDALVQEIEQAATKKPQPVGEGKKKKKAKEETVKPAEKPVESAPPAPVQTQPEQTISIEELMKRKAKEAAKAKEAKKKPDLGAAQREIEQRAKKTKAKKEDVDL